MKKNKVLVLVFAVILISFIVFFIKSYFLVKLGLPSKNERLNNMLIYQGKIALDEKDIADEIEALLAKHSNWDNLFVSDRFKAKYRNRKGIISNIDDYTNIWCISDVVENQYVIIVHCDKATNDDESENVTVEYFFKYVLDSNNEIDDLILLNKNETYTINGEEIDK